MRLPLAPAGRREMIFISLVMGIPAVIFLWAARMGITWCWPAAIILILIWAGGLAFFRDPNRRSPNDPHALLAPADGRIVENVKLDAHGLIGGPATRISIFLSVLDVHINRSPCAGVVRLIEYQPGRFLDARDPDSGQQNEANTIVIEPDQPHTGPIVVRQIAGLIARRIICSLKVGDRVRAGQRIGLIKFGSRTELIMPGHDNYDPAIQVGDKAYGAATIMARIAGGSRTQEQSQKPTEINRYA